VFAKCRGGKQQPGVHANLHREVTRERPRTPKNTSRGLATRSRLQAACGVAYGGGLRRLERREGRRGFSEISTHSLRLEQWAKVGRPLIAL